MNDFELLLYLADKAKRDTSTNKIAKETAASQQTISRKLIKMEKKGLIKRDASAKGMKIEITETGFSLLKERYDLLKRLFKDKQRITGKVKQGIGEGAFYIKKYNKKINEALGFEPYNGTLNLEVDENLNAAIVKKTPILINSFKTKERSYGSIRCYNTSINNIKSAIIIPSRTRHSPNIIEIISPVYLRDKLNLNNNDLVEVEL